MTLKQVLFRNISPRIRNALKHLYDEVRIVWNHRKGGRTFRGKWRNVTPLRVQFGCGPERKEGWLNSDLWPGPWAKPDLCLDMARPFPFDTESVAEIYSEHVVEHLDYPSTVRHFLGECYRVLKPGGAMTIGVPDLDAILENYLRAVRENRTSADLGPCSIVGHALETLNDAFHQQGEHKFLYNEAFLSALLQHFGFANIRRRPFDPRLDSEHRRVGTLYMRACKPDRSSG